MYMCTYVTEFRTRACFNAGLMFKSEIFLRSRYSYIKWAKASIKKTNHSIEWHHMGRKKPCRSRTGGRESAEHLMMFLLARDTNVLSKSSYNRKCSVAVLCCCTRRIPLLQRLKSQGGCPSTCFLAAKKVKSFCSVKLLCIPGSVTRDSHQTVM